MNAPENPERLYAFTYTTSDTLARGVVADHRRAATVDRLRFEREECGSACAEVAEYVLASVAAAAVANAPGYETAMAEANRASGLEDEVAALRAEVEALRSLAKRAADLLRPSFRLTVDGRDTPPNALAADIDAALAKGVG